MLINNEDNSNDFLLGKKLNFSWLIIEFLTTLNINYDYSK